MKKRIVGIDVARALTFMGMIIVNFRIVFGESGSNWLRNISHLFDGKAAATFVVLAGVGLALMSNSAIKNQDREKLNIIRKKIMLRAAFLFVVGLSYIWIWPADILHFYGVYMILTVWLINKRPQQILIATIGLILLYPLLMTLLDYETGWDFTTLEYLDLWTLEGFIRNLFYNGFHPVIPWAAFIFFGLWYGKQDLNDNQFVKNSLKVSSLVFVATQLVSIGLIHFLSQENYSDKQDLTSIFGTSPMPPLPIYMISGISVSVIIISACILLAQRYENHAIISALHKTGQLALTFYVGHVVIGMGIVEELTSQPLSSFSIEFSTLYALIFSACCILFAVVWLKYNTQGPLEWVMRKLLN